MKSEKIGTLKSSAFTICGILAIDTFVIPAVMGVSSITIWLLISLFFLIPYGLVTAELGCRFPQDGGIYIWVREAFGKFNATLVGWFYWVNVALWMPAIFIAFTSWFSYTFDLELTFITLGSIACFMSWLIIFICIRGIETSVVISNAAAISKVFILLTFGVMGIIYMVKNGANNSFSITNFIPKLDFNSLTFVSAIVYNLLGFELISSIASKIDNPKKTIPIMTITSSVIIASLYIIGTFGLLVALPSKNIEPLMGFVNALEELTTIFGNVDYIVFRLLMIIALFSITSNMVSWVMGAVLVFDATEYASKSKIFSKQHDKYLTPYVSYTIMGIISTILIIINFMLNENASEVFWTILAFSFVIFLLPYVWMFLSLIKLDSIKKMGTNYIIPFGKVGIYIFSTLGLFFISISIFLLFYNGDFSLVYHGMLVIGTLFITILGIIIYKRSAINEEEIYNELRNEKS
ncbi:MAG: APC family permease [Bacilli bacterium]